MLTAQMPLEIPSITSSSFPREGTVLPGITEGAIPICFVGLQIPCGQIVFCPLSLSESLLSGLKNRNSFTLCFFLGPKRIKTLYNTTCFSVEGENNYQFGLIFKRLLTLLKDMGEELKPTSKRNYSVHQRVEVSCL